jgi:hypothetical protein
MFAMVIVVVRRSGSRGSSGAAGSSGAGVQNR